MPKKQYVYSDFSLKDALTVEIKGQTYECTQFSSSWAMNEIPTAVAMLAVGRNAKSLRKANIHTQNDLLQMQEAVIYFHPNKEYSQESKWPAERQVIFRGYFTGFSYRKINGKVHAIANFIHWLATLGFSSTLTKSGHVSNPTALNAAAVLQSLGDLGAGVGAYISQLVPAQLISQNVGSDIWKSMKEIFCNLCDKAAMPVGPTGQCGGSGDFQKNDAAKAALMRIEGPATACNKPYKWGVPLKLDTLGVYSLEDAIAEAIGKETINSYSAVSFWDKLVGQFCPMFGMAVVPMVESAIVIADTPAFNGDYWADLEVDEYDAFDMSSELFRPLRAVGVVAAYDSQTQAGMEEPGNQFPIIGGCYVEDSIKPGDGMIQYIAPPPWLRMLRYQPNYVGYTTGIINAVASQIFGARGAAGPNPTPDAFGLNGNQLYKRYAHDYYVNSMLRGRSGSVSGKLRFDTAPGSIVRIDPSQEKFIGGEDTLAFPQFASVQRVTVTINAEATIGGSTFMLSHMRSETENTKPRTSTTEHPLFGKAIHGNGLHGCPLVEAYNLD